ncbi:conserved hypothetical protein [Xanthomonas campestris pv. raphani 756C]|nr:conserved hypothetical protein [Xanthomonas campestris pv. raphani 756C]
MAGYGIKQHAWMQAVAEPASDLLDVRVAGPLLEHPTTA